MIIIIIITLVCTYFKVMIVHTYFFSVLYNYVMHPRGGGGGGYFKSFLTGGVKTPPIHIKARPEKHTYSYNLT